MASVAQQRNGPKVPAQPTNMPTAFKQRPRDVRTPKMPVGQIPDPNTNPQTPAMGYGRGLGYGSASTPFTYG